MGAQIEIRAGEFAEHVVRFAVHLNVTDEMADLIIQKLDYVVKELLAPKHKS